MFKKAVKWILSGADVQVRVHSGDQLVIVVKWHGETVLRKTIDFIPGA